MVLGTACNRSGSFNAEQAAVNHQLSSAFGVTVTPTVLQSGDIVSASWQFEVAGPATQALDALRKHRPPAYSTVTDTPNRLTLARYDRGDTFELTAAISAAASDFDRKVSVVLRAYPD